MDSPTTAPRKRKGGRPKAAPESLRDSTIGVRVSAAEYDALRAKSAAMNMTPAQWLREAALSRRLPTPPVPAVNREQYAELARIGANLNQLAHSANIGLNVAVETVYLERTIQELQALRRALLGVA